MFNLFGWLSHSGTVALGWTLLHFCWEGTVVAFLHRIVDRLTSRAKSAIRYLLALTTLALMPTLMMGTFIAEMRGKPPSIVRVSPAFATSSSGTQDLNMPFLQNSSLMRTRLAESESIWLAGRVEQMLLWVDAVWAVGVLLLTIRAVGGWHRLEGMQKRARLIVPSEVSEQFHQLRVRMRLGRQVYLRLSDDLISPMAMGVLRATVLLPVSAAICMPTSQLEAVLAHELGHIRRWDYLFNLFQTAIESVLFFHPAVWWISQVVRERREVCCDEIAVSVCADATVYVQALLHLEETTRTPKLAVAIDGSDGHLLRRVFHVLEGGMIMERKMTTGVRITLACLMLLGLLGSRVQNFGAASASRIPPIDADAYPALKESAINSISSPSAEPSPRPARSMPSPKFAVRSESARAPLPPDMSAQVANGGSTKGSTYLDEMRSAGYPFDLKTDLQKLEDLRTTGVTPEYAKSMIDASLGKPTVRELIAMKSMGVTPEYVSALRQSKLSPKDFKDLIAGRTLAVTPEYLSAMNQASMGSLDMLDLVQLKAIGVTPAYARWLKQEFPQITLKQSEQAALFHIDEGFLTHARALGFESLNIKDLLRLKVSGVIAERR